MLITKIELQNFLAYKSSVSVDLTGIGLACLSGVNGAGKSSLLDAITWALWGRARGKGDDDLIHKGQKEMTVCVEFIQGEARFRVERQRKFGGNAKLRFLGFDGKVLGNWNLLHEGLRDAQPKIIEQIKLDYETFISSAFLQQGRADSFTTKAPGERRKILSEILGLSQWKVYEERAKSALEDERIKQTQLDALIAEKDRLIAQEGEFIRRLEIATSKFEVASRVRAEKQTAFEEVKGAQDRFQELMKTIEAGNTRAKRLQADINALEAEVHRIADKRDHYAKLLEQRPQIEAGHAALEDARQHDSAFRRRERESTKLEKDVIRLENALEREKDRRQQESRTLQKTIRELEKTVATIPQLTELIHIKARELDSLNTKQAHQQTLRDRYTRFQSEHESLQTENGQLKAEMDAIKKRLEALRTAENAVCPVCQQPLNADHIHSLEESFNSEGKSRGDQHRANKARLQTLSEEISRANGQIQQLETELRGHAMLQSDLAKTEQRLDSAREAAQNLAHQQTQLMILEAELREDHYAPEIRRELETARATLESLGYDRSADEQNQQSLKQLQSYERSKQELETAEQELPQLELDLTEKIERGTRWTADLEALHAEIKRYESQRATLEAAVTQEHLRRAELNEANKAAERANTEKIAAEQEVNSIRAARVYREEKLAERNLIAQRVTIYEQLREAFSPKGIPAMIIESALPELEEGANRLLRMISDGRLAIQIPTQRTLKSGEISETIEIRISDELGERDYALYSGGESFRVNFALRVALSQFLARRAGSQLRTLFVDEGFGALDAEGRESLVEAIQKISEEFDLILIVTHIEELRDTFQTHLRVSKNRDGSGSTVELLYT
jgi:exonuclease SbcC